MKDRLDQHFPDRWIGSDGAIYWPPQSPDSMLTDFYLWGFVKDHIYQPPLPRHVVEQKAIINAAVTQVTPETLQKCGRR